MPTDPNAPTEALRRPARRWRNRPGSRRDVRTGIGACRGVNGDITLARVSLAGFYLSSQTRIPTGAGNTEPAQVTHQSRGRNALLRQTG